jgi:serine/threonine protein kinase
MISYAMKVVPLTRLDLIGPYQVAEVVGVGGMAAVYRATRYDENGWVAIKLMHEHMVREHIEKCRRGVQEPDRVNPLHMFLDEVILHQELEHPNIVRYLAEGHHKHMRDGAVIEQPYLVMEYVHGTSLIR